MRVIVVTIITTIIVVSFSIYSVFALNTSAMDMLKTLETIDLAVSHGDWDSAIDEVNVLNEQWTKNEMLWTILLEHKVIDNIKLSIAHIKAFLISEDISQVRAEIAGLYLYLEDIPESEKLNIQNVF